MTVGMLPLARCGRCGLRGVPWALACCPRCGARYGWAMIDPAAVAVFVYALHYEQRRAIRRHVMRAAEDLTAQVLIHGEARFAGMTLQGRPHPSVVGPSPMAVAEAAWRSEQSAAVRAYRMAW